MSTVILAAGDFPKHPIALAALHGADRIVCCDGAVAQLLSHGFQPTAIVGDLDSLPAELRTRFSDIVFHDSNQENNDLTKAFNFCIAHDFRDITALGTTGLREDHTIANIALLADYAEIAPTTKIITDHGVFHAILAPGCKLSVTPGKQISLFSFSPDDPISATGVKYPVERLKLTRWWCATLNEAVADTINLSFEKGPLLVFVTHDVK